MKLWLDTGSLEEIREINRWGVLSGITTNPTLIGKEHKPFETHLKEIATEVDGPVSGEVVATDRDGMIEEGLKIASIAPNIVVKCPVTPDGYAAVRELGRQGIKTNMTLCFNPNQALLAAEVGATYISPFLGRVDDISNDGLALLAEIVEIYRMQGYETQVLAASLRHPQHVVESAKIGADVATMPYDVFSKLVNHPLTDLGLKRFLDDWDKYQKALKG
ncbi:MAG: fructose-6-phosphate aldolase [Actinobacteria bacterium]|nr:MAG: fructose-6-phosphate aldolase [Actinomycetota bacterium]